MAPGSVGDACPLLHPRIYCVAPLRLLKARSGLLPRQRAILLLKEREGWSIADAP
jgi:hypothetical protein